jgi:hypothetical protein
MILRSSFYSSSHKWAHRVDNEKANTTLPDIVGSTREVSLIVFAHKKGYTPITEEEYPYRSVDMLHIRLTGKGHDMISMQKNYFDHFLQVKELWISFDDPESLSVLLHLPFWDTVEVLLVRSHTCDLQEYKGGIPKSKSLKRVDINAKRWSHCNLIKDLDVEVRIRSKKRTLPDIHIPKLIYLRFHTSESQGILDKNKDTLKTLIVIPDHGSTLPDLSNLLMLEHLHIMCYSLHRQRDKEVLRRLLERTTCLKQITCVDFERIKRLIDETDNGSVRVLLGSENFQLSINAEPRKRCLAATEVFFLAGKRFFGKDMVNMVGKCLFNTVCDVRAWDKKPRQKKLKF